LIAPKKLDNQLDSKLECARLGDFPRNHRNGTEKWGDLGSKSVGKSTWTGDQRMG